MTYIGEEKEENDEMRDYYQNQHHFYPSGFYVYDLEQLIDGTVRKFKLSSAIGGQCSLINNSKFSNRFSFLKNYSTIVVIPFPHLNLINFIGMG